MTTKQKQKLIDRYNSLLEYRDETSKQYALVRLEYKQALTASDTSPLLIENLLNTLQDARVDYNYALGKLNAVFEILSMFGISLPS